MPGTRPFLHPGRQAELLDAEGRPFGFCGEVHPRIARGWGLDARLYVAEWDLAAIGPPASVASTEIPREPAGIDLPAAKWLVEQQGAILVGSDTSGLEHGPSPMEPSTFIPVHRYLLIQQGVHIGEFHHLEALAKETRRVEAAGLYSAARAMPWTR